MLGAFLLALFALPAFARNKKAGAVAPCQIKFSVVSQDYLKNVTQGLSEKWAKWYAKKVERKYPDVCYAPPAPDVPLVFFITVTPAVYHGAYVDTTESTHDSPVRGTVTDEDGNESDIDGTVTTTSTSSTTVPYTIHYGVYTLTVETEEGPGKWKPRHRFQQGHLYRLVYGIPVGKGHHPVKAVIEEAAKWIHDGGLMNPLESVAPEN